MASSLVCHAGEWQGPYCLEAPCDSAPQGIAHARGLSRCAGTPSRKACRYDCEPGYFAVGFPECIRGAWELPDFARCDEAPCTEEPDVAHAADLSTCANRRSGEVCPLQCEPGFESTGELRCLRGSWLLAECAAHCDAPPIGISHAEDLSHCAGTPLGGSCSLVCSLGFRPSGQLRCTEGGRWEGALCYSVAAELNEAVVARIGLSGLEASVAMSWSSPSAASRGHSRSCCVWRRIWSRWGSWNKRLAGPSTTCASGSSAQAAPIVQVSCVDSGRSSEVPRSSHGACVTAFVLRVARGCSAPRLGVGRCVPRGSRCR